jgi:hypothetical protein
MRRFVTLAVLLLFAVPFGVSLAGCKKATVVDYCNGENSGLAVGQLTTLDLEPRLTGLSLNQGQISQVSGPSGTDCKGTSVSAGNPTYGSSNMTLVDVQPTTGRICAGTWNRQTGGGIPDYTVCTPGAASGTAFITASAQSVSSNPIPIYVHPIVTSIVLGPPSTDCVNDPASNCYNTKVVNGACLPTPVAAIACVAGAYVPGCAYVGNSCLSQGQSAQLVARAFTGTNIALPANNVSCQVGPLTFSSLNPATVNIDANGLATAAAPGSGIIQANNVLTSSSAGFFSTCPPASITLSAAGSTAPPAAPLAVNTNSSQSLVATVLDTQNNPINNLQLTYVSTTPITIPATGNVITPVYPGSGTISALCLPPSCNGSSYNLIGLYGNGQPVVSNPVRINSSGTANSTVLYIASTGSQYIQPVDFTTTSQAAPTRLPYAPNSMVITNDSSTVYMGSSTELMVLSVAGSTVTLSAQYNGIVGKVLAVSPDSSTVVVTDPTRNLTYLVTSTGTVNTEIGGTGTRAAWTQDSQTVYITTTDGRMLVHSQFAGWQPVATGPVTDVEVTVPNVGIYLAGSQVQARTNCPGVTVNNANTGFNQTTSIAFYPEVAFQPAASADLLAATNDGMHILGAGVATGFSDIVTNVKSGGCPVPFTNTFNAAKPFTGIAPTAITGVLPTTDSAFAVVTYLGTGAAVPQYAPATGALSLIPLQTTANGVPVAPVAGVVSSDNQTVYVGTSGDNLVHRLTRGTAGFADTTAPVVPALIGLTGGTATPNLLVQKPRKATN